MINKLSVPFAGLLVILSVGQISAQSLVETGPLMSTTSPQASLSQLLWDNRNINTTTSGIVSNDLRGRHPDSSLVNTADDFVVPADVQWAIDSIYARGFSTVVGVVDSYAVVIYANDPANKPGAIIYQRAVIPANGIRFDSLQLRLPSPVILPPGTYWLSIYAIYNTGTVLSQTRWNWYTGPTAIGLVSHIQDFTGLFGIPPFPWTPVTSLGVPNPSCYFAIFGTSQPMTAVNHALRLPTPGVNTNYVQIPFQSGMVGFGNNITIEAWVKIGGTTTANTVLNKGAASFDYQLGINATSSNPFFRAGVTVVIASTVNIPAGVWTHLAVTYDGATVRFYVDGTLAFSQASTLSLGTSTNEMRIGRGNADPGSGNLDEVRLWSVARTQGQIDSTKCKKYPGSFTSTTGLLALWHFDSTFVDSINNFNGTATGNVGFDTASLPCVTVGVADDGQALPSDYELGQNYPNPFNPTTQIRFVVPSESNVSLRIYDVLGRHVATLVDGRVAAGAHTVGWDGARTEGGRVSSGVYFYHLEAKSLNGDAAFTHAKKMIYLK